MTDERFVDLMGATNLIPGPNSTELAIHLGYERAGWRGLVLAGVLLHPAGRADSAVLAWAYVSTANPRRRDLLYGWCPVVVAIVVGRWCRLPTAVKSAGRLSSRPA